MDEDLLKKLLEASTFKLLLIGFILGLSTIGRAMLVAGIAGLWPF